MKTPFIYPLGQLDWLGADNITQAGCCFNALTYDDQLFKSWNINFPLALERSVFKRKAEFLAGRYCSKIALSKLGRYPSTVGTGKFRNPLWPMGIKGSISHSAQFAIAVVSQDQAIVGLGVDIEKTVTPSVVEETSSYILQTQELKFLRHATMTPEQVFTIIFSMKESFYKAAFPLVNAFFDFNAVTVIHWDSEAKEVQFRLNFSLHEKLPKDMCFIGKYCAVPIHDLNQPTGISTNQLQETFASLVII
ncbi:MAG: 4'-phosphopantetheinyl transferase superfamily protein [Gammaproteobacteria bacterium]|nr:4'-phosphopantetheinyl transferase superfamily protein [Gammaproteobacteria bacterium]